MEEKKKEELLKKKVTFEKYRRVFLRQFSDTDRQKISDVQGFIADTWLQLQHLRTQNELFFDRLDDEAKKRFEEDCKATKEAYSAINLFQLCFFPNR